jgi:antitoxin ChpS
MSAATLRRLGGSTVVAIPPALLDALGLAAEAKVDVSVEGGRLIITPRPRPRFTLEELMAQCDLDAPFTEEERAWGRAPPVGREEI